MKAAGKGRNFLLNIFSALAFLAAFYHLLNLLHPLDASPAWRHAAFAAISLFCGYGFLKRPRFFLWLSALLLIQQLYSHGSYALQQWTTQKKVDWPSIAILLLFPVAFFCLVADRKANRR